MGYERWVNQIGVVQYDNLFSQMKASSEYIFTITMCVLYKSITIRCTKCQIFGIWHTKHQKQSIMRCVKCQKVMTFVTVRSYVWNGMDENCKSFNIFLFLLFSLLSHLSFLSPICLSLSSSLILTLSFSFLPFSRAHRCPHPPPISPSNRPYQATIDLIT